VQALFVVTGILGASTTGLVAWARLQRTWSTVRLGCWGYNRRCWCAAVLFKMCGVRAADSSCDRHFGGINYPLGGVGAIAENMVDGEAWLFAVGFIGWEDVCQAVVCCAAVAWHDCLG
jgi:hypothetical protein